VFFQVSFPITAFIIIAIFERFVLFEMCGPLLHYISQTWDGGAVGMRRRLRGR